MTLNVRLSVESVSRTHVGKVRKLNEDSLLDRADVGLWAVADGMGGHQAGDVASNMIVDALKGVDDFSSGYAFMADARDTIQRVNRTLLARAAALSPGAVIGSTVVTLLMYDSHYACLWAGDSRIYLLRGDRFEQLTRDHSMIQELVDSGSINRAEARHHKRSNVITRAVGVTDSLALDMVQGEIAAGDVFLLCSDGLTGMLEDREIHQILASASLDAAADALIEATLDRGARDNVAVVLVRAGRNPDDTLDQTQTSAWPTR